MGSKQSARKQKSTIINNENFYHFQVIHQNTPMCPLKHADEACCGACSSSHAADKACCGSCLRSAAIDGQSINYSASGPQRPIVVQAFDQHFIIVYLVPDRFIIQVTKRCFILLTIMIYFRYRSPYYWYTYGCFLVLVSLSFIQSPDHEFVVKVEWKCRTASLIRKWLRSFPSFL